MSPELFERHRTLLELAMDALSSKVAFRPFPGASSECSQGVVTEGESLFKSYSDAFFYLDQPASGGRVGDEVSRFGIAFKVQYPAMSLDSIIVAASEARAGWSEAGAEFRIGICLEILHQLQARAYELALAVMHTTGLPFELAFAEDVAQGMSCALEMLARTYKEIRSIPLQEKPEGDGETPPRYVRNVQLLGAGVAAVMGGRTQPLFELLPALLANLACGTPVIVRPAHDVTLPLAIVASVARQVVKANAGDPNVVTLMIDDPWNTIALEMASRDAIRVIDFSGGLDVANRIRERAVQAVTRLNCWGANPAILEGADNLPMMVRAIVQSRLRASGRLSDCIRAILVPSTGVRTPSGQVGIEDLEVLLAAELERYAHDPTMAASTLRSSPDVGQLLVEAPEVAGLQRIVPQRWIRHPMYPQAIMLLPGLTRARWNESGAGHAGRLGGALLLIECDSVLDCIAAAVAMCKEVGAHFAAVYSDDAGILSTARHALREVTSKVDANFLWPLLPGQTSAFRDGAPHAFPASGVLAALGADPLAGRFRVVEAREQV